jgi:hypothetical protein
MTTTNRFAFIAALRTSVPWNLANLPQDVQFSFCVYLRAHDLSALQLTCTAFNDPELIKFVIRHIAKEVYHPSLTKGYNSNSSFDDIFSSYESLRDMELLVIARIISSEAPKEGGYYVSKSWCRAALKWLESETTEAAATQHKNNNNNNNKKTKKMSKTRRRIRDRRLSDVSPPWSVINSDLCCMHGNLHESKRGQKRTLTKQSWRILKKFYPESKDFASSLDSCLECRFATDNATRLIANAKTAAKKERKLLFCDPRARSFFNRTTGVPDELAAITFNYCNNDESGDGISNGISTSPLCCAMTNINLKDAEGGEEQTLEKVEEMYHIIPRSFCAAWRSYMRNGTPGDPPRLDCSELFCAAHGMPLLPRHLERYLSGQFTNLLPTTREESERLDREDQDSVEIVSCSELDSINYGIRHDDDSHVKFNLKTGGARGAKNMIDMFQFSTKPCNLCYYKVGASYHNQKCSTQLLRSNLTARNSSRTPKKKV